MPTNKRVNFAANKIRDAFTCLKYPGDDNIIRQTDQIHLEKSQLLEYFRGKQWQNITLEDLHINYVGDESACLEFMTEEARKYYLPAYILIVLEHYDEADSVIDTLVDALTQKDHKENANDDFTAWANAFSIAQHAAIKEFLDWLRQEHKEDFLSNELESALESWK